MKAILLIFLLLATPAWATDSIGLKLDIGRGGQCVDDPQFMRKNHMRMLRHQRDETVRQGIRGGRYSLAQCVNCHASKKDDNVLGSSEHFCQGCHEYAAVHIDCFECHSSKRKLVAEVGK
jgi:cytochrome c553